MSAIGRDLHGSLVLEACRNAGVDTSPCRESVAHATSTYVSTFDANGELDVAVNDMRILEELDPGTIDAQRSLLRPR